MTEASSPHPTCPKCGAPAVFDNPNVYHYECGCNWLYVGGGVGANGTVVHTGGFGAGFVDGSGRVFIQSPQNETKTRELLSRLYRAVIAHDSQSVYVPAYQWKATLEEKMAALRAASDLLRESRDV